MACPLEKINDHVLLFPSELWINSAKTGVVPGPTWPTLRAAGFSYARLEKTFPLAMREFKKIPQTLQLFPGTLCGLLFWADF